VSYKTIIPAEGWFFRHDNSVPGELPIVYQVAAWALRDPDSNNSTPVVGLIAVAINSREGSTLMEPPPVAGYYLHTTQLDEKEREASLKR